MNAHRRLGAGLACVALLVAACGSGDDDDDAIATTSTTRAGTTTTADPADLGRYHDVGSPRDLGPGQVVGVSADGTAALVFAEDPAANRFGCEGAPARFLWTVPLDGTRRPKRAIEGSHQPGNSELVRSRTGTLALVERCEEFLSGIVTATEEAGGRLTDLTPVRGLDTDAAPDVTWSAAGETLVVVTLEAGPTGQRRAVLRLDPGRGRTETLVDGGDAVGAVELADRTLVVARRSEGGGASVTAGTRRFELDAFELAVAPDGATVAVAGATGLHLVGAGDPTKLADGTIYTVTWSSDGQALAFTRAPEPQTTGRVEVAIVTLDGRTTPVAENAGFSAAHFSPDGDRLVYSRAEPAKSAEGETFDEPFVTAVALG